MHGAADLEKAFSLHLRAAQRDFPALYAVGVAYLEGDGVEPDAGKALRFLHRAAALEDASAKNWLRTIVEAHGGRLWAENRHAGGADFRFTLPIARRGRRGMSAERNADGDFWPRRSASVREEPRSEPYVFTFGG